MAEVNEKVLTGEGLAELWKLIQAEDAKLVAADVRIETGSYVGTGSYAAQDNSPHNSLTFSFVPKIVIVANTSSRVGGTAIFLYGASYADSTFQTGSNDWAKYDVQWSEKTLRWGSTANAEAQLNISGRTYGYIAIG